jgi:DNA processing protein
MPLKNLSDRLSEQDTLFWLAAARLPEMNPLLVNRWSETFGDLRAVFSAPAKELAARGLSLKQIDSLQNIHWQAIEKDFAWCEKNHVQIITYAEPAYPKLLREISSAPLLLYVQGQVPLLNEPQIAIVGSRNPTPGGKELAHQFSTMLANVGLHITSGLALGIDAAAHRGALEPPSKTLAVLGNGLNYIYPASHRKLSEEIRANGALVTEFSPYEQPKALHFPRRNRIISGLSLGVLVVEAALRSGSLITAHYAAEQGREVFAIPGTIHNPLARGCHKLIREGAKLVETTEDILEEFSTLKTVFVTTHSLPGSKQLPVFEKNLSLSHSVNSTNHATLLGGMQTLLAQIGYEATPLDVIIMRSGLTTHEVSSMLLSLEMQGMVQITHGGYQRMKVKGQEI